MRVKLMDGTIKKMSREELKNVICEELNKIEMDNIDRELLKQLYSNDVYNELHYDYFEVQNLKEILLKDGYDKRYEAKKLSDIVREFFEFNYEDKYDDYGDDECYNYKTVKDLNEIFPEGDDFYEDLDYCCNVFSFTDKPYIDKEGNEWYLVDKDRYIG